MGMKPVSMIVAAPGRPAMRNTGQELLLSPEQDGSLSIYGTVLNGGTGRHGTAYNRCGSHSDHEEKRTWG